MPLAGAGAGGDTMGSDSIGAIGAGAIVAGATLFDRGAVFLAAGLAFARELLDAGFAAFFLAVFTALTALFADALTGRAFFLAMRFLAAGRLAFAAGRFLGLLFFAMVTNLLAFQLLTAE